MTKQRGQSVEFRDYREYLPGDDIGHIDWKVYGKLRRLDAIISEVPLILRYDLKFGVSKMAVARTAIDTLKLLVRRRLGTR